jgi:hypothetical protein
MTTFAKGPAARCHWALSLRHQHRQGHALLQARVHVPAGRQRTDIHVYTYTCAQPARSKSDCISKWPGNCYDNGENITPALRF